MMWAKSNNGPINLSIAHPPHRLNKQEYINMEFPRPKIVVSKCLGFAACRYNKQMISCEAVKRLTPIADFIPICPECEIGLGVPRIPIRVILHNKSLQLKQLKTAKDITEDMNNFLGSFFGNLNDVDGFILKSRSPSCGYKEVKIYPSLEKVPALSKGAGFFGAKVVSDYPFHPVEDDGRLHNLSIREAFFTKLFVYIKFKAIEKTCFMKNLVEFHANHKYMFMAYNETAMRQLGSIVANHEQKQVDEVYMNYKKVLPTVFPCSPKKGAYINVLLHIYGYFKKLLSTSEKSFFLEKINQLGQRKIPLSVCLNLLESWIHRFENKYLLTQTLFKPFPEALMDMSDSSSD